MVEAPEPLREFGARVRARRTALGWSQENLGEAANMHWTAISQLERAVRTPSLRTVARLAAALQIDPAKLVKGIEPW